MIEKGIFPKTRRFDLVVPRPPLPTQVVIGKDILRKVSGEVDLSPYNLFVIITENRLMYPFGAKLTEGLQKTGKPVRVFTSEGSEKNKTLAEASRILTDVLKIGSGVGRKTTLIFALGGGVIGDVGGLVAKLALRGIDCDQVPTTFLSMVDSSLGGKTGVDHEGLKNRIGAFHQPKATIMDIDNLESLPPREIGSGFGEAIKHAFSDPKIFKFISGENIESIMKNDRKLIRLLELSARYKMSIVSQDFEEKTGVRQVLNLGHTLGHAIETAGGLMQFTHGEAVAIGLTGTILISNKLGLLSEQDKNKMLEVMKRFNLPTSTADVHRDVRIDRDSLWKIISSDKKVINGVPKFVLLKGIGKFKAGCQVDAKIVNAALDVITS